MDRALAINPADHTARRNRALALLALGRADEAAVIFQEMGQVNRELSQLRSEIGNIEGQVRQLQSEVGRYISRYTRRNPMCYEVAKSERTMVEVMRMLRISIAMNHKLADFK